MSAFNLSFSISPSLSYFLPHGCNTYLGKVSSGLMIKLVMAGAGGKRYTAVLTDTRGKKMKQDEYEKQWNHLHLLVFTIFVVFFDAIASGNIPNAYHDTEAKHDSSKTNDDRNLNEQSPI